MHYYKAFGYTGLIVGTFLIILLGIYLNVSSFAILSLAFFSVLTFFGLTLAIKILTGKERLVYYYYQISVFLVASVLLLLLNVSIFPHLDIFVLGLGACLACFRAGCLTVGCCHGRPCRFGLRYGEEHAKAGFTNYYKDLKLFPIQAVELLWVIGIVLVGINLLLKNPFPGSVFAWYVVAYAAGRFHFEFLRGDPGRLFFSSFSEAQWISLFSVLFIVITGYSEMIASHWWHSGVLLYMTATMIAISVTSQLQKSKAYQLLNANHVKEIAEALEMSRCFSGNRSEISNVHLKFTSKGIRLSCSRINTGKGLIQQYTFSSSEETMIKPVAVTLAKLTLKLIKADGPSKLIQGQRGVFHLLVFCDG